MSGPGPIGRVRAAAVLGMALLAFESLAAEEVWREYGPARGLFRVRFPAEPQLSHHEAGTPFGSVRETRYTLRAGDAVLIAESHELPAMAVALMPARSVLDRARVSLIESEEGIPMEPRELADQRVPAQEFSYRLPGHPPRYRRARAFLAGTRLYLLVGTAATPVGPEPQVDRFFESFRFWSEGDEPPGPAGSRSRAE